MGTSFTQGGASLFTISTPLGKDKLLLKGFRGSEGMSRLFRFELDLLSEDPDIKYPDIIGKSVTISLMQADGKPRYFNGVISRFGQGVSDDLFISYHAEMVPWLWFLTRTGDCRIFQNKTIPDIIKQVFNDLGFSDFSESLASSYPSRDYCVQYRETDFNFVSRLMEEYGIFYFFKHEEGKHTLVLGDSPSASQDCPGQNEFRFYVKTSADQEEDIVNGWHAEQELRTGKCTLTDYNFETPRSSLLVSTSTTESVGGNSKFDTYDYPGKYLKSSDGDSLTRIRMEEEESVHLVLHGTSDARSMVTGYKFKLKDHYRGDMNTSYLLTDIEHTARTTSYSTSKGAKEDHYSNSFTCIPASVHFRPLRLTPHPTVMGPQPAVVVGPSGEEIYTDKYGRVKVQFFWDRKGKEDENSSCWVRVSQIWAGKNWGAIFLPRIGQEVIVDFLEGDPDQPLITGRVYNADQMPPGSLPDSMNKSGIQTRSTKGGGTDNWNALTWDDTKGKELFFMHAEKDMMVNIENDETWTVGHDQDIQVKNDRTESVEEGNETVEIKKGNRSHTVTQGNETLTVKTGDRLVEVKTGNDTHKVATGNRLVEVSTGNDDHKIKMGNRGVEISMGNDSLKISMGNQTTKLDLGSSSTEAMQSIKLTVGQNSIEINQMGVTIKGMMVSVEGQIQTQVKGAITQVNGDGMLQCKGGIVMIN